jgi:predicted RNase H-like HicB family nuclease
MKLFVTLEPDETGMIVAECPAIPGCVSQGRTEAEALENIREAIAGCLEARLANGMPLTIRSVRLRFQSNGDAALRVGGASCPSFSEGGMV